MIRYEYAVYDEVYTLYYISFTTIVNYSLPFILLSLVIDTLLTGVAGLSFPLLLFPATAAAVGSDVSGVDCWRSS